MYKLRLLFLFVASILLLSHSTMGQDISASLQQTYRDKDSLIVTLTFKNESNKPTYLVCGIGGLWFYDYIPDHVNYGSPRADIDARKAFQSIEKIGNTKDTIEFVLPITKKRYQIGFKGDTIDVFHTISELLEVHNNKNVSYDIPIPPEGSELIEWQYQDIDLYKILQKEFNANEEDEFNFSSNTFVFQPNEEKSIDFDLGYLFLRRATYKLELNFKTDDTCYKKELKFLERLGFRRFKGELTSNTLYIVSE